jgi:SAM-dependent MidA family methyltransferase
MEQLMKIIKEEIRTKGRITFERYMELALYHPLYGYYSSGAASIGKTGDFYTSSQATRMFGTLMAEVYVKLAGKSGPDFVEMGAGEGLFAADFLRALARSHPLEYGRCRYFIVESATGMAARQKEALSDIGDKVTWNEDLKNLPDIEGIFFSNELVDAFPFHMVKQGPDGLSEIYVCLQEGPGGHEGQAGHGAKRQEERHGEQGGQGEKLAFATGPLSTQKLAIHFDRLTPKLPAGMVTEANLRISDWMGKLGGKLKKGFVITVDYGYSAEEYYSPAKMSGTALCHYKHSVNEDFFERVGEQDVTAHVDFTTIALEGDNSGLAPELFCDQGQFLMETLPWFEDSARRINASQEELIEAGQGIKTLLHPEWLGGAFKVLVQSKECSLDGLFGRIRNGVRQLEPRLAARGKSR